MPLSGWTYYRPLTDSTGGSLAGAVCRIALTAADFDFSLAKSDGSDLRVYDETAAAVLPSWLLDYDGVAQTATLFYKATLTSHAHSLSYGNPAAPAVSSFPGVFTHGSGFDADWGDLTTAVAGAGGSATRFPGVAGTSDPRRLKVWRQAEAPTLSISDLNNAGVSNPGGVYTGIREFNLIRDSLNRILPIGGKYYASFSRRPNVNTTTIDGWMASSTSKFGPWSNFVQLYTTGSEHVNSPGCWLKIGSTYYLFTTFGWDNSGAETPGLVVQLRTSTDLVTWSAASTVLSPGVFNDQTSGACTDIGNPWVCPLADGTYMIVVEGYNSANAKWACFGATSTDLRTWTPLNSGNYLVPKGTAGTWDANGAANPKCFQLPDHSCVIQYNGSDDPVNLDWEHGYATAPTAAGPYTKLTENPVVGRPPGTYGYETAHLSWDEDGVTIFNVGQRFDTTSATAHAYNLFAETKQGGLLLSRDPASFTDGAIAGVLLGTGTFTAESRSVMTASRNNNATPILLGLVNAAAVPTPAATATFASLRALEILTNSLDRSNPGDVNLVYYDGGSVRHTWNGTAWDTGFNYLPRDFAREIVSSITDDGTNYVLKVIYADDGSTVAGPASIAKASVLSTPLGRVLWSGDPFTDGQTAGLFYRYISVRPYVATEPILSLGDLTATTPFSPTPGSVMGLLENGSYLLEENPTGAVALEQVLLVTASYLLLEGGSHVLLESGTFSLTLETPPTVGGLLDLSHIDPSQTTQLVITTDRLDIDAEQTTQL